MHLCYALCVRARVNTCVCVRVCVCECGAICQTLFCLFSGSCGQCWSLSLTARYSLSSLPPFFITASLHTIPTSCSYPDRETNSADWIARFLTSSLRLSLPLFTSLRLGSFCAQVFFLLGFIRFIRVITSVCCRFWSTQNLLQFGPYSSQVCCISICGSEVGSSRKHPTLFRLACPCSCMSPHLRPFASPYSLVPRSALALRSQNKIKERIQARQTAPALRGCCPPVRWPSSCPWRRASTACHRCYWIRWTSWYLYRPPSTGLCWSRARTANARMRSWCPAGVVWSSSTKSAAWTKRRPSPRVSPPTLTVPWIPRPPYPLRTHRTHRCCAR